MNRSMKHIATALMLNLAVAGVYAQNHGADAQSQVRMTFSGNGGPSAINLQQPNTNTIEENVAGNGRLGPFTFRDLRAGATAPQPSSTCSGVFFPSLAGGGILRFADGSLMKVSLVEGGDCIDFVAFQAHCTLTLQINGGTGRFENASGTLTYSETAVPVVLDVLNNPVLTTEVGQITGTISGLREEEGRDEGHQ